MSPRRKPKDEAARPLVWDTVGAAHQLGMARSTVHELIKQGKLRALKNGHRTVIADSELQRYVAELPEKEVG
jgi:excisionase family DNA binding protein